MSCGAETEANTLLTTLTTGLTFSIPTVNLADPLLQLPTVLSDRMYQKVTGPTNAELTTGTVGGTGTFDMMMSSVRAHLKDEYERGRISGAEYVKAYVELTQAAMGAAVQFLLGRDQAYWEAQKSQVAAITGRVGLEMTKVTLAKTQFEAQTAKAAYGLTAMKISTESMQYCTGKYQLDNILPAQFTLVKEQGEVQRAQTLDTRTDGATVLGVLGKQKALYAQQITSYQRDAETKAAKIFSDAWITQKTIDEGLVPPTGFTNASVDTVLTALKTNNGLG